METPDGHFHYIRWSSANSTDSEKLFKVFDLLHFDIVSFYFPFREFIRPRYAVV